jgi:hypothetical protein
VCHRDRSGWRGQETVASSFVEERKVKLNAVAPLKPRSLTIGGVTPIPLSVTTVPAGPLDGLTMATDSDGSELGAPRSGARGVRYRDARGDAATRASAHVGAYLAEPGLVRNC